VRGHLAEGQTHLSTALARDSAAEPSPERGAALHWLGAIEGWRGNRSVRGELWEQSLRVHQQLGSEEWIARSLLALGNHSKEGPDNSAARSFFERALRHFRAAGYARGIVSGLTCLGHLDFEDGEYHEARRRFDEALPIARDLGIAFSLAPVSGGLA